VLKQSEKDVDSAMKKSAGWKEAGGDPQAREGVLYAIGTGLHFSPPWKRGAETKKST